MVLRLKMIGCILFTSCLFASSGNAQTTLTIKPGSKIDLQVNTPTAIECLTNSTTQCYIRSTIGSHYCQAGRALVAHWSSKDNRFYSVSGQFCMTMEQLSLAVDNLRKLGVCK